MYAVVTTWRLHLTKSSDAERRDFIRGLVRRGISAAREQGVVDIVMIAVDPDLLIGISLFDSLEEALATRPVALAFVEDHYAETLELISRVTGQAYELADISDLNLALIRQGRETRATANGPIFAHLATWRLEPSVRPPEDLLPFLRDVMAHRLPEMLELGLMDVLWVRTADDTVLVVRLTEHPEALDVLYGDDALAENAELLAGKAALVERSVGQAFDIPALLGPD
jgi:hypothetical protein